MRRPIATIAPILPVFLLVAACFGPVQDLYPPKAEEKAKRVYIISHGWHSGIAVARQDLSPAMLPEVDDFPHAEYLEFGWGERDYYLAAEPTPWMAIKAAFWPTRSVLRVIGIDRPPDIFYADREIVEIDLSRKGFGRLERFIANSFLRAPDAVAPIKLSQQYIGKFYPARGKFHIFRTCNTWVAEALRTSGYPVTPLYAITAGNLMCQASRFGRAVEHPDIGR